MSGDSPSGKTTIERCGGQRSVSGQPGHAGGKRILAMGKKMTRLDRIIETLSAKGVPYYELAAAFAKDRMNRTKTQMYADTIVELRTGFDTVPEGQCKRATREVLTSPPNPLLPNLQTTPEA
jgi:hypothetical protein